MNIIGDIVQNINNSFNLLNNEPMEDLQENEQLVDSMGIEQISTIPLQQWYSTFSQQNDYIHDNSYNTLSYLNKLGYTHAIWELCEFHDVPDVCDTLHGRQFTLTELLLNAQHNPPSPIFTLSHPQCFCFLKCFPPNTPEELPDDAPGLPIDRTNPKLTMRYKRKLFKNMFEIFIDAFTLLPPQDDVLKYSSKNIELFQKYAGSKQPTHSYITPVIVNKNINCYLPMHFSRQIEQNTIGCQIKINGGFSVVYVNNLNRLMIIPTQALSKFSFTNGEEINASSVEQGDFIVVDDETLGIVQYKHNNSFVCYIPEWNNVYELENQQIVRLIK